MKKEIRNRWNESKKQHSLAGIDFPLCGRYYVGQFFHLSLLFHILPRDSESHDIEQTPLVKNTALGMQGEHKFSFRALELSFFLTLSPNLLQTLADILLYSPVPFLPV